MSILFVLSLLGKGESLADENNNIYTVHPPQLSVPKGEPGEIRRIVTQLAPESTEKAKV